MLLLGNKMDLANKRQTTTEEGKQHTKELSTMITEKSAQTGCNMKQLFRPVGSALLGMANVQERSKGRMANIKPDKLQEPLASGGGCFH